MHLQQQVSNQTTLRHTHGKGKDRTHLVSLENIALLVLHLNCVTHGYMYAPFTKRKVMMVAFLLSSSGAFL